MNNNNTTSDIYDEPVVISNTSKIIINALILVFALFGNLLLVTSLLRSKKLRKSVTNMLILNLAFCDIIIVVVSVCIDLVQMQYDYFPFGAFGCRVIYPFSTYAVICVIITLILLAMERFTAIVHPFQYRIIRRYTLQTIILSHTIAIICVIPYSYHLKLTDIDGYLSCTEDWSYKSQSAYTIFLFIIQYAFPLPVIIVLYSYSWFRVKQQNDEIIRVAEQQKGRVGRLNEEELDKARSELIARYMKTQNHSKLKKIFSKVKHKTIRSRSHSYTSQLAVLRHNQTMSMLKSFILVVTLFAIFMLPNQITWLTLTVSNASVSDAWSTVAYWLTYTNSIFNPILYGINPKFRRIYVTEIKEIMNFCWEKICRHPLFTKTTSPYSMDAESTMISDADSIMLRRRRHCIQQRSFSIDSDNSFQYNNQRSLSIDSTESISPLLQKRSNTITTTLDASTNEKIDFFYSDLNNVFPDKQLDSKDNLPSEQQDTIAAGSSPLSRRGSLLYKSVLQNAMKKRISSSSSNEDMEYSNERLGRRGSASSVQNDFGRRGRSSSIQNDVFLARASNTSFDIVNPERLRRNARQELQQIDEIIDIEEIVPSKKFVSFLDEHENKEEKEDENNTNNNKVEVESLEVVTSSNNHRDANVTCVVDGKTIILHFNEQNLHKLKFLTETNL